MGPNNLVSRALDVSGLKFKDPPDASELELYTWLMTQQETEGFMIYHSDVDEDRTQQLTLLPTRFLIVQVF